jgi:biotin carboxyl carrier protein
VKYVVKLGGKRFEVEVGNLDERPVIATVEGSRFEVWPEAEVVQPLQAATAPATDTAASVPASAPTVTPNQPTPRMSRRTSGPDTGQTDDSRQVVYAPIPGVLLSVAVHEGDTIGVGQELCVLEAMKMKNIIRATRDGQIASILATPGQRVKHNDPLFEYAG